MYCMYVNVVVKVRVDESSASVVLPMELVTDDAGSVVPPSLLVNKSCIP